MIMDTKTRQELQETSVCIISSLRVLTILCKLFSIFLHGTVDKTRATVIYKTLSTVHRWFLHLESVATLYTLGRRSTGRYRPGT